MFDVYPARPHILIVDDVPANLRALSDALSAGYELHFATSGPEALRLICEGVLPDLILLDVMMPEMDGYAVCRILKGNANLRHIPVIFVSALDGATNEIFGLEIGADDYITKPYDQDITLARIRMHLRQKAVAESQCVKSLSNPCNAARSRFVRKGSAWEIAFQNEPAFRLRDRQGLAYLQILLSHPGRFFSSEELAFLVVPKARERMLAASGLGQRSVQQLRTLSRLCDSPPGPHGTSMTGSVWITLVEQLADELQRSNLWDDDSLSAAEDRERLRKAVSNAIRRVMAAIADISPALARHLEFPVLRLGKQLIYSPPEKVDWAVTEDRRGSGMDLQP